MLIQVDYKELLLERPHSREALLMRVAEKGWKTAPVPKCLTMPQVSRWFKTCLISPCAFSSCARRSPLWSYNPSRSTGTLDLKTRHAWTTCDVCASTSRHALRSRHGSSRPGPKSLGRYSVNAAEPVAQAVVPQVGNYSQYGVQFQQQQ